MRLKYLKKIAKKEIYDYSPVKGFVELWDFSLSNLNQESREEAVSVVASISYGNEMAKNPKKLWDFLIKKGHKSPFEFIRFPMRKDDSYFYIGIEHSLRNKRIFTFEEELHQRNFKHFVLSQISSRLDSDSASEKDLENFIKWHKQTIATFKVKVPLFVRSQYHRHRCCSYLELSRRYVKPDKVEFEFWYPDGLLNEATGLTFQELSYFYQELESMYKILLKIGYKPEVARSVLPQSLYTVFWVMKDYKCARNFYVERYSKQAQEQIREVAKAELELLYKYQPEFLGQYIKVIGDDKLGLYDKGGFTIRILDIQDKYKQMQSNDWNKDVKYVYVEYGDKDYYARFNLEIGLFDEKILKEEVNR